MYCLSLTVMSSQEVPWKKCCYYIQMCEVETLSVIPAPHLFVCTHTDGWHHAEHLDVTLISCQICESGGQPLLRLLRSDNSVNLSLMCDLSLEYSWEGREQMDIMFYGAVCYCMTMHLFKIHLEPRWHALFDYQCCLSPVSTGNRFVVRYDVEYRITYVNKIKGILTKD